LKPGSIETVVQEIKNNPEALFCKVSIRIGYSPETISEEIREKIFKLISKGLDIIRADFVEKTAKIKKWDAGVIEGEGISIESAKWSALLDNMESPEIIYSFIITMGENLDKFIDEKKNDSLFDAYVLDALGAHCAEYFADCVEKSIRSYSSSKEYDWSRRFSPGYCDWELASGQAAIFQFLRPDAIGVKCMPSGTIIPEKSVSAVMIGAKKVPIKSPCRFCKDTECKYRRREE